MFGDCSQDGATEGTHKIYCGKHQTQRRRGTEDAGRRESLFRLKLATQLNGQRQDTEYHGEKIDKTVVHSG